MATRPCLQNSEINNFQQRRYVIGKKIGQGTHATVHLAKFFDGNSTRTIKLACKIFDKENAPKDILRCFPRELEILTKLDNPHIIHVHKILQRGPKFFIFMRYAENGDLLDFIQQTGPVPEKLSKLWFHQMISGLHYLHKLNIAHRDLKCENILLTNKFHIKLADFGFARYCVNAEGRRILSQTYCGSAAYAAPEIVANIPYNPKLADVWSLGVILFIMLNGIMPFNDKHLHKLLKDQWNKKWAFQPKIRHLISAAAKNLVKKILEPDITLRYTVDRIMSHEWVCMKTEKCCLNSEENSTPVVHHEVITKVNYK
ncbi:testis-specific serine/threonine-protein kinase 3-like [Trichogramma pretiosum]|uniref:testis-specific serine/threonine-protein kinase 3-like n=1 Tax=Trichogramma pretiosum TaxID=7493 RepID=UPI0006C99DC5|nr:testis-specific serine/threonine-protein kinase 3-like [Trichogramma pretiosum]